MKIPAHEELLLARCARRENDAVKTLIELYGERVYGFIRSALGLRAELVHPLLIKSFSETIQETQPFNMTEPFRVTVMRKLIHGITNQLKNKDSSATEKGMDLQRMIVFEALSRLAWNRRVLLLLRDQMDFDFEEIASILSVPIKQLRAETQETRLEFRKHIEEVLRKK